MSSKDTKNTLERRTIPVEDVELRVERDADGKPTKISGYAAVFNKDSVDLGGFIERIKPGAFQNTLKTSDVRALVNHDSNLLLGRTKSGTLALKENKAGLKFEVSIPDTQAGRDAAESIERGDMDGCSFSFIVKEEEWKFNDEDLDLRIVVKVDPLYDVGPVTYPAYPDTSVAVRSYEKAKEARDTETVESDEKTEADDKPEDETAQASDESESETEKNTENDAQVEENAGESAGESAGETEELGKNALTPAEEDELLMQKAMERSEQLDRLPIDLIIK